MCYLTVVIVGQHQRETVTETLCLKNYKQTYIN